MENPFEIIIERLDAIERLLCEIKSGKQVDMFLLCMLMS